MMRAAAMRKRAFGYSNIFDGERQVQEAVRSLESAVKAVDKAYDAAQSAMEQMGALSFQGNRSDLSEEEIDYIADIDNWGKDYGEIIDQNLFHLNALSEVMEDARYAGDSL
jgi:hypothetical protein